MSKTICRTTAKEKKPSYSSPFDTPIQPAAALSNQGRRFSLPSAGTAANGGNHMNEIIVIRTSDPDGSVFCSILGALQGKDVQVLHAANFEASAPSTLTLGDIEIFPWQHRVMKAGAEIHLNYGEFSILYCMARCPGRVFSREQLYNAAWGEDYELGTNTVDNIIWRLRNKLEPDPKHPTYIKTVFRVGYKIEV